MIKRRFYKQEHGDKDVPSDSSSSSDSDLDAEPSVDSEEEDDDNNIVMKSKKKEQPSSSSSSGYETEDSSANEVNLDSSGSPTNDDDSGDENYKGAINDSRFSADKSFGMRITQSTKADNDAMKNNVLDCVLKSKSVFKCKLCPRILCLNEETLKAHLKSKKHVRSEKLLKEGRLKMMLNSDGEIEELESDGETHQERHAATLALAENASKDSRKNKGRQRQKQRKILNKKTPDDLMPTNTKKSVKRSAKKRRKSDT